MATKDSRETTVRKLNGALYDAVQMLDAASERVERENRSLSRDPFAEDLKRVARRCREVMRSADQ